MKTRSLLRRLATFALTAGMLLILGGCHEDLPPEELHAPVVQPDPIVSEAPAELILACAPEESFHPITGSNRTNLMLGGLMYEGLFCVGGNFAAQNQLCSSYTVLADHLTWIFSLRDGVTFSDGSPLSAQQVVYSLNLARSSTLYSGRLAGVQSVSAAGTDVQIVLSRPNSGLPALLDIPVVKESDGKVPLGTGPYLLTDHGDGLILTANTNWWQDAELPVDSIQLRPMREAEDLLHAFGTKEVTMVSDDLTGTGAMGFSGSYEVIDFPTSSMLYIGFNCAAGPCQNVNVRLALQQSMDREAVAMTQLSRHAVPAALPAPPCSEIYDETLAEQLEFDPDAVRKRLTDAGWTSGENGYIKNGQPLKLRLLSASDNEHKAAAARFLADSLTKAGFRVQLDLLPWTDYLEALKQGRFDLYLGEVRLTGDLDPNVLISPDGALNYGHYADPVIPQLLSEFRIAQGGGRIAAGRAVYRQLANQAPFTVLCFKNWSVLTQWRLLSGITPTQQNVFYGFAEWTIGQ